jgi:biotin synthase
VITTRTYQDRLDTLAAVRAAGINVCCGGIMGMGETEVDRAQLLHTLATLPEHPQSVPINQLMQVPGTPLHGAAKPDAFEFVRVIAVARLLMPKSHVRLSAGRSEMTQETQALCFLAGANSIFYGEKLLTTENPDQQHDRELFQRLGIRAEAPRCAAPTAQGLGDEVAGIVTPRDLTDYHAGLSNDAEVLVV